jgi:type IV pilus assembly protein PilZ
MTASGGAVERDQDANKRDGDRLEHPVLVAYRSVDRFLSDFGTNISRGGVFVNTAQPLAVGTPVRLLVSLPDQDVPIEVSGRVLRVQEASSGTPGMGIEFVDLAPEVRERIDGFVASLREKLGQDPAGDE